jgi:hypothetical protein
VENYDFSYLHFCVIWLCNGGGWVMKVLKKIWEELKVTGGRENSIMRSLCTNKCWCVEMNEGKVSWACRVPGSGEKCMKPNHECDAIAVILAVTLQNVCCCQTQSLCHSLHTTQLYHI